MAVRPTFLFAKPSFFKILSLLSYCNRSSDELNSELWPSANKQSLSKQLLAKLVNVLTGHAFARLSNPDDVVVGPLDRAVVASFLPQVAYVRYFAVNSSST